MISYQASGVTGWSSLAWYEIITGSLEDVPVTR
jgi:hypothetical protein